MLSSRLRIPLLTLGLALSAGCGSSKDDSAAAATDPLVVTTDKGAVAGTSLGKTRSFVGIPYAAPPVGPLRWKSPQPAAAWATPRDAKTLGSQCPQFGLFTGKWDDDTNEDCLTLNVWTPTGATQRPVMVWIHGGGFTAGSGDLSGYDGQKLSEVGDVVVVTLNYRLGVLGYLAHAALSAEDPAHPGSGNYGIEDQRAALQWVKTNIAAFGGDPANVMIFGESAGAESVFTHMVSPGSAGLFQRALAESGYLLAMPTLTAAQAQGDKLATQVGCTDAASVLTCLRALDPQMLSSALFHPALGKLDPNWAPVIGTDVLPDNPLASMRAGTVAKVPFIVGTLENEANLGYAVSTFPDDKSVHDAFAAMVPADRLDALIAQYPVAAFPTRKDAVEQASTDSAFACPSRRVARYAATAGVPTRLYRFQHAIENAPIAGLGAFHGSEIPFVFGNPYVESTIRFDVSDDERPLSAAVMGYWTRFATTGDPNGGGGPAWPAYDAAGDMALVLDTTIVAQTGLTSGRCDFWDSVQPY